MFIKIKRAGWLCLVIFLLWAIPAAFAQDGKNTSDGVSGQKPLSFLSITTTDGSKVQDSTVVPTEPKFVLQFDKNIVNSTLWENNRKCFGLVSQDNENIPISVTKVDDTIDFTQRQNVFIQPANPLRPGTSYYLKISPDLRAKNGFSTLGGTTNGQGVTISFRTIGQAEAKTAAQTPASNDGQNTIQPDSGNKLTPESASSPDNTGSSISSPSELPGTAGSGEAQVQSSLAQQQPGPGNDVSADIKRNWPVVFPVVLIAGWAAMEVYMKRKKG